MTLYLKAHRKSKDVLITILEKITNLSKLMVIRCDGVPVNIGKNNGIIRKLEEYIQHKLQWKVSHMNNIFVCILYFKYI